MDSYLSRVEKHRDASLQRDIFNKAFVDWAVCDDLPLRQASSERLYHLLNTCSPVAAELQKASKTSVRDMIMAEYTVAKAQIKQLLHESVSDIHLSIDAWTSDSKLPLLGIYINFTALNYFQN